MKYRLCSRREIETTGAGIFASDLFVPANLVRVFGKPDPTATPPNRPANQRDDSDYTDAEFWFQQLDDTGAWTRVVVGLRPVHVLRVLERPLVAFWESLDPAKLYVVGHPVTGAYVDDFRAWLSGALADGV